MNAPIPNSSSSPLDSSALAILIVDDSDTGRKLQRITLEAEGFSIVEARDGVEALLVLERQAVRAIISDVLMPRMDGFELCRRVRQDARFRNLPFFIYTATYNSPSDAKMAVLVGADKYLVKPAPTPMLINAVNELLADPKFQTDRHVQPPEELVVMREYNAVLVRKLEERNQDLERTQAELLRSHHKLQLQADELGRLNEGLEKRVTERTADLEMRNGELSDALARVNELSGLLPICSHCKKIRDDKNYWHSVENYISKHSAARFSHGYCPQCYETIVKPQIEAVKQQAEKQARHEREL